MVCSVHVQSSLKPSAFLCEWVSQVSGCKEIEDENDDAAYTPVDIYSTGRDVGVHLRGEELVQRRKEEELKVEKSSSLNTISSITDGMFDDVLPPVRTNINPLKYKA